MRNVIVGTAGHVDHGKTCLIRALTGTDTDRLKEEKKRGITIDLGFAEMPNPSGQQIGIIDVPGHERFVRNMLAGIGGIDLVLLVVAADEGVMPQTIEHFEILKMLDIKKGIVVITKMDLVDEDWLELVKDDVAATVKGTFLEGAPVVAVSSHTGENIDQLRALILEKVKDVANRREDPSLLRIPIDRVFTMEGFGTVITGTLVEGSVRVGDEVQIYPGERIAKVRNLQVHGKAVDAAFAGQRTAVNLVNVKKDEIKRGDVLAAKGSLEQTRMLDVKIRMFDDAPRTLVNGSRLHLYYGSAEALCKAVLLDADALESGASGYAQLRMEEEVAVRKGDRFIIRFYSPVETIGGGVILDANPVKHKRFRKEVIDALKILEGGDEEAVLEQILRETSKLLPSKKDLTVRLGRTTEEVSSGLMKLVSEGKAVSLSEDTYVHVEYTEKVRKATEDILAEYYGKNPISPGMQKGEFRKKLADKLHIADIKNIDLLLSHLVKKEQLRDLGNSVALPGHRVEYTPELLALISRLEKRYLDAGFEIPELEDCIQDEKDKELAKQMVEAMSESGTLKKLTYQYYMHSSHWEEAMKRFRNHMEQHGKITLAEYRDLLNTSRKYAVLILEYLDQQKITKMVDDARILL
ncbi:MAG TPA: selenocysteine-specific translation elongation factor [Bacillota bacterium]|jgi:selenocysteine-specific elongation factor|nr:selenocysteine-specific translation elongation factor [Bacillota bacterium]